MIKTPRLSMAFVAMLGLAACVEDATVGGANFFLGGVPENGSFTRSVRSLRVYDDALRIRAPKDYCVDTEASSPRTGFVVLAGCRSLGASGAAPGIAGLITVQVGDVETAIVSGAEAELTALLSSNQGRALLSSTGAGARIFVDQVRKDEAAVAVHFTDNAPSPFGAVQPEEWRVFFDLNGRLVTLGVRGFANAPLTRESGATLMSLAVAEIRAANPTSQLASTVSQ